MLRLAWALALGIVGVLGCTTGSHMTPPMVDGGPLTPDGGPAPDGSAQCSVYCGPLSACCGEGEECVADACLPRCETNRCGTHDELCCAAGELCVGGACTPAGRECVRTVDCADGETCDPVARVCVPITENTCRVTLPSGQFAPELQWEWNDEDVYVTPVVVQLTDDNGDGRIDPRDVPDVVVLSRVFVDHLLDGNRRVVRLTALSGDDGRVLWQTSVDYAFCFLQSPAAGDIDGDGLVEIVAMMGVYGEPDTMGVVNPVCGFGADNRLAAFDHTGAMKWTSPVSHYLNSDDAISIADLDADGRPEVVVGAGAYDGAGQMIWTTRSGNIIRAYGYDLDGDGRQEFVSSSAGFAAEGGAPLWSTDLGQTGYSAVGDVTGDQVPDLVLSRWGNISVVDGHSFRTLIGPITEGGGLTYSGAPTIGDFDGDGRAEVGVMMSHSYRVFDFIDGEPSDEYTVWRVRIEDQSIASTGSTLFDFDADGAVEVVFNDECHLQIRSGRTGELIWSADNTSATFWEYPVIVDVDNDGNAEIVAVANDIGNPPRGCSTRTIPYRSANSYHGVRVFQDRLDHWVQTRTVWNQYSYNIDNVNDDGTIPTRPARNIDTHNSFRVNRLLDPSALTLAPDLEVVNLQANSSLCTLRITLRARVRNAGAWGVPAGVRVAFYAADDDRLLGTAITTEPLLSGASSWAEIDVEDPPISTTDASVHFYARVDDDGTGFGGHTECDEDNNTSEAIGAVCTDPI